MPTLVHLDGAPGVGKSTIAARWVADHPGALCCDVDRLRRLVGGWADDFAGTGALVRPLALAMVRAHLDGGHDVVLPEMLADETERARFRDAALSAGHRYVHVVLTAAAGQAVARFYARDTGDPLHAVIRRVVDADGGPAVVEELDRRLTGPGASPDAVLVDASGDVESTYRAVLAAVGA